MYRSFDEGIKHFFRPRTSEELPKQEVAKAAAIVTIILGMSSLLCLGGIGGSGLLYSYKIINLPPSWFVSFIEAIGNINPFWGLWSITGLGVFVGGGLTIWSICRICKFYKTESKICAIQQQIQQEDSARQDFFLRNLFTDSMPEILTDKSNSAVLTKEYPNISDKIKNLPKDHCTFLQGRGNSGVFVANDKGDFKYLEVSERVRIGENLLGLGFQYYDDKNFY